MTRRERRAVLRAMAFIHADEDHGGDYNAGMDILARLVGLPELGVQMRDVKPISIFELLASSEVDREQDLQVSGARQ